MLQEPQDHYVQKVAKLDSGLTRKMRSAYTESGLLLSVSYRLLSLDL
jgi:hypothetical protein